MAWEFSPSFLSWGNRESNAQGSKANRRLHHTYPSRETATILTILIKSNLIQEIGCQCVGKARGEKRNDQ